MKKYHFHHQIKSVIISMLAGGRGRNQHQLFTKLTFYLPLPIQPSLKTFAGFTTVVNQNKKF